MSEHTSNAIREHKHFLTKVAYVVVLCTALVIFVITAFRTVTWWDSVSYTTTAHCLGVPAPPGSLLTVIAGWVLTLLVPASYEAFALNILAGVAGALAAGIIFWTSLKALSTDSSGVRYDSDVMYGLVAVSVAGGTLTLAFADTFWLHSTKFTPYIFTALFTAVILWSLLKWWQDADRTGSRHWLVVAAFLIGLDFSIHRTNALLMPGVIAWIALRSPRELFTLKTICFCTLGFAAGLSVHFLQMLLASRNPFMNFNDPSTLQGFWDYISLKQHGGGWLLSLFPRKAPFWSYQVMDYVKVFAANFFTMSGALGVIGLLPGLLGGLGMVVLVWKNWRLASGLILLFLCASLGAVVYFNIPPDFFRPFDRHYLPSFVIFTIFIVYGMVVAALAIHRLFRHRIAVGLAILALSLALPAAQVVRNFHDHDWSRNRFAYDYGANLLRPLPPNTILFTFGDMDTYGPWYDQVVEGRRPDVTIANVPLLNTPWFVKQLISRDTLFPLGLSDGEIDSLRIRSWSDTLVAVVSASGDTLTMLQVGPSIEDKYLLVQDWILLRVIQQNAYQRPLYLSAGGATNTPPWIRDHLAFEGLAYRFVPDSMPAVDLQLVSDIIFNRYSYAGFNDPSIFIDEASMSVVSMYWGMFAKYGMEAKKAAAHTEYEARRSQFLELMPPQRFPSIPEQLRAFMAAVERGDM